MQSFILIAVAQFLPLVEYRNQNRVTAETMTYYDIWNLATGNAVAEYDTEAEALELIRWTVETYGRNDASSWALTEIDEDGEERPVAEGDALIDRAFSVRA